MSGDHQDTFLTYVETTQEGERVLALLRPDARAVVEAYMAKHPGVGVKKAIRATVNFGGPMWRHPDTAHSSLARLSSTALSTACKVNQPLSAFNQERPGGNK